MIEGGQWALYKDRVVWVVGATPPTAIVCSGMFEPIEDFYLDKIDYSDLEEINCEGCWGWMPSVCENNCPHSSSGSVKK